MAKATNPLLHVQRLVQKEAERLQLIASNDRLDFHTLHLISLICWRLNNQVMQATNELWEPEDEA